MEFLWFFVNTSHYFLSESSVEVQPIAASKEAQGAAYLYSFPS